jgi:hypothetical protein
MAGIPKSALKIVKNISSNYTRNTDAAIYNGLLIVPKVFTPYLLLQREKAGMGGN